MLPRFHKRLFVAEWEKKSLVLLLLKLSFWTTHHLGAVGENNSLLATYCVIIVCSVLQHNYQESLIVPAGHHKKDYSLFIPSTQYLSYGAVRNLKKHSHSPCARLWVKFSSCSAAYNIVNEFVCASTSKKLKSFFSKF